MTNPLEITITRQPKVRDFEVALPDGRSIVVQAEHEDAAAGAARNFLMRETGEKRASAQGFGYADNLARGFAQGATFGFGDEIAAAGDATFGPLVDKGLGAMGWGKTNTSTAPNWSARYDENLEAERGQDKKFRADNPGADLTSHIAGGVSGALATLPAWLLRTLPLPALMGGRVGGGAVQGSVLGGVAGFGEGEGGLDERLRSGGIGALIGAGAGAATVPVAGALGAAGNAAIESRFGRYVGDKVGGVMNSTADMLDKFAPKVTPRSLSAAAPEGGQPVAADSVLGNVAEGLRTSAPEILDNAAARRIADAMQRGGVHVPQAQARLTELGQDAMLADVNPMTTRLAQTMYLKPGTAPEIIGNALDARNRRMGDRITGTINEAMPNSGPAVLEAERLRLQRGNQGRRDFAESVGPDAPYTISPEMRQIMQEAPAVQKVMDTIMAQARENGVTLTPAQVAHRVKQQLAGNADAAFMGGTAVNKADVGGLAVRWRTALHEANPAIRAADENWQAGTARMEALDLGRQFMKQGMGEVADAVSPAILARRIPNMTAEEAQAFIAGAADTMTTAAQGSTRQGRALMQALDENNNVRRKLVTMLGQENASALFNRAMSERAFTGLDRTVRGGSDTAGKLWSMMDDAASGMPSIPTTTHGVLGRVASKVMDAYHGARAGNEDVRGRIAQMLTETNPAANAEMLDLIARQLSMASRPRASRGVAIGAAQQGQGFLQGQGF